MSQLVSMRFSIYTLVSGCRTGSHESQAMSAEREAREGREGRKISACRHTIVLTLLPSARARPQKLTDKYQTHNETTAILKHAGDSNNSC